MNYEAQHVGGWFDSLFEGLWEPAVAESMRKRLVHTQYTRSATTSLVSDLFDIYVELVSDGFPEIAFSGKPTAKENRTVASGFGRTLLETVTRAKQPFQVVDAFYNALYFKYLEGVVPRKYAFPKSAIETAESKGEVFNTDTISRTLSKNVRRAGLFALGGIALYALFSKGIPGIVEARQ